MKNWLKLLFVPIFTGALTLSALAFDGFTDPKIVPVSIVNEDVPGGLQVILAGGTNAVGTVTVDDTTPISVSVTEPLTAVDSAFSTTNLLAGNGNFDSGWLDARGYSQVQTHILASHDGTLTFRFSETTNGTDIVRTLSLPYTAGAAPHQFQLYAAPVFADYIQYSFTNTTTNTQTDFYYETKFLTKSLSPQQLRLDAPIAGGMISTVGRSVLMGTTEGGGVYENVSVSAEGHVEVSVLEPRSAFGEVSTVEPSPVSQVDFVYGVNSDLVNSTSTGSGSVSGDNQLIEVHSGAAASSTAQANSKRYIRYRPGQGALGRYTAVFDTAKPGNRQYAGVFTPSMSDGFGFGYDSNGVFGIVRIDGGTENWVSQTSWNADTCDGGNDSSNPSGINLNPLLGNVYQVKYQYLGFGAIFYSVENPINGQFTVVHVDQYANSSTNTSIAQPSLNMTWRSDNGTNDTDVVLKAASGALFLEGKQEFLGPRRGDDVTLASVGISSNYGALYIKNATSFGTGATAVPNRSQIRLRSISCGNSEGTANPGATITLRWYKNPTSVSTNILYTPINGQSLDEGVTITNGTSISSTCSLPDEYGVSGGNLEWVGVTAVNGSLLANVKDEDLFLNPGDVGVLSVEVAGQSVEAVSVGATWSEDL